MDKTKRYLSVAFVAVLAIVIVVSLIGMILLKKKPVILQGQIEATEIRISGKLPGRIDTFLVKEGQNVRQGDTLVVINSPEALAKYQQVNAMENIAKYQHQKVDEGTRSKSSLPCNNCGINPNRIYNWRRLPMIGSMPCIKIAW